MKRNFEQHEFGYLIEKQIRTINIVNNMPLIKNINKQIPLTFCKLF